MKKIIYNHVQFLRGISVLLVFFYHLKLQYFNYGFLGVDIFFVISGYVITSLIYDEFKLTKKFNFYSFYVKRFKRIYPVLFFILSISLLFIIFFQPLELFLNNFKIYFLSLFGISNLYYLIKKNDYFDTVFNDPFAHTWSLGVEEQFYIIFPLFLFFLLKNKSYLINISILVILILIGISFSFIFQENTKLIFYSPIFRFWEFLLGTLTFFLSKKNKFKSSYLSLLIFAILIFSISVSKNINLINITIITTLLTSIFILIYRKDKKTIFNCIIENNFLIFLGNISYSFYLWHLPIIYFYDLYFLNTFFRIPLLFFLILMFSYFSFTYVENKFRYLKINIKLTPKKIILSTFLASLIIYINIAAYKDGFNLILKNKVKDSLYSLNYLERKINYTDRVNFYNININGNEIYRFCVESSKLYKLDSSGLRTNCLKEGKQRNRIFYIEGNSRTANFIPMFNEIRINDTIYINLLSKTLENINFELVNNLKKTYKEVIYTTNIDNIEELEKLIIKTKNFEQEIKVLILGAIPNIDNNFDPLKCFIKNIDCAYESSNDIINRNLEVLNLKIKKLVDSNYSFNYFDPYYAICPDVLCKAFDKKDNLITHRDNSHLTIEGSILMKDKFLDFYNKKYKSE